MRTSLGLILDFSRNSTNNKWGLISDGLLQFFNDFLASAGIDMIVLAVEAHPLERHLFTATLLSVRPRLVRASVMAFPISAVLSNISVVDFLAAEGAMPCLILYVFHMDFIFFRFFVIQ